MVSATGYSKGTGGEDASTTTPPPAMTNAQQTYAFLRSADTSTRDSIIDSIAAHYQISRSEAFDEVTAAGAEHLLDYLTGSVRAATSVLMQRAGLA